MRVINNYLFICYLVINSSVSWVIITPITDHRFIRPTLINTIIFRQNSPSAFTPIGFYTDMYGNTTISNKTLRIKIFLNILYTLYTDNYLYILIKLIKLIKLTVTYTYTDFKLNVKFVSLNKNLKRWPQPNSGWI